MEQMIVILRNIKVSGNFIERQYYIISFYDFLNTTSSIYILFFSCITFQICVQYHLAKKFALFSFFTLISKNQTIVKCSMI